MPGNAQGNGTIVYMHGLGMGDTTISACPMFEKLKENYRVCIMDRPGNGLSDDTTQEQTNENVISTYRQVLQEAGAEEPYILVAHSVAGIYADYWAQKYPDEIKSIIYMDADPVECYVEEGKISSMNLLISKAENVASELGLQRIFVSQNTLVGEDESHIYTEEEMQMRIYLMYHNTFSKATLSEMELYYDNAKEVLIVKEI